jgi:1,2-diacylglycerol 3-alpha-glucosyltransferase
MYEEYLHFVSKKLAKTFRKPMMRIVKRIMRKHILNSNEIIVPSQKIKDLMLSYNINREYNIVPTGIHLDVFKEESHKKEDVLNLRKELGLKEDDFVCLFVGRVSLEKGIDKLIDGFKEINKDDIKFVIIGGGPHFKDIKERVEKEGLKDKIIFTGIVPWEDIGLYYQLGDVFLNASISETQGLAYIEALASGQPLIVKYDKVLENVVIDGENGLFFHEVPELTENILKLYNDKELYNKIKANTLKSVLKYEDKVFVKNVLEVYKKAINQ